MTRRDERRRIGRSVERVFLVMIGIGLAASSSAQAEVESELVHKGLAAYRALDYVAAAALINQALSESPTREEKQVCYRTLGLAQAALDRVKEARRSFEQLLRIEPNAELDRGVTPRIRALFEEARSQVATEGKAMPPFALATVEPRAQPAAPHEGQQVVLDGGYRGGMVQRAALFHRVRGDMSFVRREAQAGVQGRFRFELPGRSVRAPAVEYYLVLLDGQGAPVARAGALGAPLTFEVRQRPVYRRSWFWGVLASGAVTIAVTTALAVTLPSPGGGDEGAVSVRVH